MKKKELSFQKNYSKKRNKTEMESLTSGRRKGIRGRFDENFSNQIQSTKRMKKIKKKHHKTTIPPEPDEYERTQTETYTNTQTNDYTDKDVYNYKDKKTEGYKDTETDNYKKKEAYKHKDIQAYNHKNIQKYNLSVAIKKFSQIKPEGHFKAFSSC